ncbi:DUF6359 domain-containing protein [Alkalihalobacillus pseudalcaliphilus]|uniref:DUF6359 domain-containing protein n=1 Tax=Alkalihalobacillus pseudalcaliphilus TaxID=79884 RepID=UPI00064DA24E|nr:DUF6359 domain-containing protein [Alkalihalobacillus pseudalcaliphilus]KMK76596.1 endonuclease [Alkalihalobacillus pseudalcaliphilus]
MNNHRFIRALSVFLIVLLTVTSVMPAWQGQAQSADGVISVTEAIEHNQGRATVEGYIVGTVASQNNFTLAPPFTSKTNVAIAEHPDETDIRKMLPIQLPTGQVRNGLNVVDNPENYHAKVQITGDLEPYFSVPGLRSASGFQIIEYTNEPAPPEDPQHISIEQARQLSMNTEVIVQGVVTVDTDTISSGNQFATYIQDETAGINIFHFNKSNFPTLQKGDFVEVRGHLTEYNGLLEVVPTESGVTKISAGHPLPEPISLNLGDLNDPVIAEPLEGQLVEVEGFIQHIPDSPAGGGYNVSLIDENFVGTTVRVMEGTGAIEHITTGSWYSVTGILSQYNTYQLLPRSSNDFTLLDEQPEAPNPEGKYESTVARITDGDTIHLATPVLGATAVRFLNMDTPETYQSIKNELDENQKYHGDLATEYMKELLEVGDEVEVLVGPEATDQYGRLLAQIVRKSDGLNINLEMVRAGYATTYFIWPVGDAEDYELYQETVRKAKDAEIGIWNPENPLLEMPFEFRARETGNGLHRYVGNSDTKTYVEPNEWEQVPVDKRIFFASVEEAEANGYVEAGEEIIPDEELISMQILSVNDLHGKIDQTYPVTVGEELLQVGRFDYVAAYLNEWSKRNQNTFIVHAGDMIGGSSPVSALFQDEPVIEMMNEIGFDFGTVGNHEFDEGTEELMRIVKGGDHPEGKGSPGYAGMDFPLLCANCLDKESGEHFLPPYEVVEVEGEQVAFIGVNTTDTVNMVIPDGIKDIEFTDEVEAVNSAVEELKAQGVRAIIVLAHMAATQSGETAVGPAADLAKEVDDEVDIIFAGHNHQIVNAMVDDVLIVQAYEYGKAFGAVDVTIDPVTGDIVEKEAEIIYVDQAKIEPEPAVGAILADYENRVAPILNEVVGHAAIDMVGGYSNDGDTALGNLIADSMLWQMKSDFALMNGGGIRDQLPAGEITFNRLFNIVPFNNVLVTFEVTGAELREILNAQITSYGPDFSIAGFHYTWDQTSDEVVDIMLLDGSLIDESRTYTVTTNNYMAESNGDKYRLMGQYAKNMVTGPEDLEALIAFVKTFHEPIAYHVEGRIAEISSLPEEEPTPEPEPENPKPEEPKPETPKPEEPKPHPEEPIDFLIADIKMSGHEATISSENLDMLAESATLIVDLSSVESEELVLSLTVEQMRLLVKKKVSLELISTGLTLLIPLENFTGEQSFQLFINQLVYTEGTPSTVYELIIKEGKDLVKTFDVPITLSFTYVADAVTNSENLAVYHWNEKKQQWDVLPSSSVDSERVTATTNHFSIFTVLEGDKEQLDEEEKNGNDHNKEKDREQNQDDEVDGGGTGGTGDNNKKTLPHTATSHYQWLLLGVLLFIISVIMFQYNRRRIAMN